MNKMEIIRKLKSLSEEVAELSRECGRTIEIDSPTEENPYYECVRIGNTLDGYKEYLDMWKWKLNGKWICLINSKRLDDPENFNILERNGAK